jgi:hypothetical protein
MGSMPVAQFQLGDIAFKCLPVALFLRKNRRFLFDNPKTGISIHQAEHFCLPFVISGEIALELSGIRSTAMTIETGFTDEPGAILQMRPLVRFRIAAGCQQNLTFWSK